MRSVPQRMRRRKGLSRWRGSVILYRTLRKGHREGDCGGFKCVHKFSDIPPSTSLRHGLDVMTASHEEVMEGTSVTPWGSRCHVTRMLQPPCGEPRVARS